MAETFSAEGKTAALPTNPSLTGDQARYVETPVEIEEKEVQYVTGLKLYSVLLGVTLVAFLVMLDQTIMVTALPRISVQFNSLKDIG